MNYQTYEVHPDFKSIISCYWTLEVPKTNETQKQRIVPDGTIEMAFILGDDIKRYTSESDFIIQPRAMVLGQTIDPFFIEPIGYVNTFAVRFYPLGFANFISLPIRSLANKETALEELFDKADAMNLELDIIHASSAKERINIIEQFLLSKLNKQVMFNNVVESTIDILLSSNGNTSISTILKDDLSKRRQLERTFAKKIGLSPKQLAKLIRFQSALKMLLNEETENFTNIAYKNDYYDQAHFIKDFKEYTGISPKEFLGDEKMALSSIFYK